MNILDIAKECGATRVVDRFDVPFQTYDIAFDSEQLQAFAAAISAKAIEDYKESQVAIEFIDYTTDSARLDWLQNNVDSGFTRVNIDKVMLPNEATKV